MEFLSREDFFALSVAEIEELTGVEADGEDEASYRERAWENYKQEVGTQEEWVGIEGENTPEAED